MSSARFALCFFFRVFFLIWLRLAGCAKLWLCIYVFVDQRSRIVVWGKNALSVEGKIVLRCWCFWGGVCGRSNSKNIKQSWCSWKDCLMFLNVQVFCLLSYVIKPRISPLFARKEDSTWDITECGAFLAADNTTDGASIPFSLSLSRSLSLGLSLSLSLPPPPPTPPSLPPSSLPILHSYTRRYWCRPRHHLQFDSSRH